MSEKLKETPMLPEEAQRAFIGGKRYGVEALAEQVVSGNIPIEDFRVIKDVDDNGNPIYKESGKKLRVPLSFIHGPNGVKHRQPSRKRN